MLVAGSITFGSTVVTDTARLAALLPQVCAGSLASLYIVLTLSPHLFLTRTGLPHRSPDPAQINLLNTSATVYLGTNAFPVCSAALQTSGAQCVCFSSCPTPSMLLQYQDVIRSAAAQQASVQAAAAAQRASRVFLFLFVSHSALSLFPPTMTGCNLSSFHCLSHISLTRLRC
jgi:hypothetical protein